MIKSDTILRAENPTFDQYHGLENELVTIKVPEITNTYVPISYKEMIDSTMELLDKEGLKVNSRRYSTNKTRTQVIAYYGIEGDNEQFGKQLAWRNSYDRSMSVAFTSGANVWICGNGCVSGDMVFKKKHVGDVKVELEEAIKEQIGSIQETYDRMLTDFERLQHHPLSFKEMAEVCGRMFIEEQVITPNQLSKLRKELLKPTFDYGYEGYDFNNNDAYSLYQHSTYILKDAHPYMNARQLYKLHSFFMEKVALKN